MAGGLFGLQPMVWIVGGGGLGAILGSFLVTICLRWPRGESAATGRSHCDGCRSTLVARELVPVVSYVAQRGQCRGCRQMIDPLHVRVELTAAAIGAAAFGLAPGLQGIAWATMAWIMLPLAILDWRHFWLPDRLTLLLAGSGLVLGGWASGASLANRFGAGVAGYVSLWLIARIYRDIKGREGMGQGDPKLFGAIGLWLGLAAMPSALLLAAVIGILSAVAADGEGISVGKTPVAFGTMLCLSAIPALVFSGTF